MLLFLASFIVFIHCLIGCVTWVEMNNSTKQRNKYATVAAVWLLSTLLCAYAQFDLIPLSVCFVAWFFLDKQYKNMWCGLKMFFKWACSFFFKTLLNIFLALFLLSPAAALAIKNIF